MGILKILWLITSGAVILDHIIRNYKIPKNINAQTIKKYILHKSGRVGVGQTQEEEKEVGQPPEIETQEEEKIDRRQFVRKGETVEWF